MCYTQCPTNSYPGLVYDGVVAQENNEYDPIVAGTCLDYTNHLFFQSSGKGLVVPGPDNLEDVPP